MASGGKEGSSDMFSLGKETEQVTSANVSSKQSFYIQNPGKLLYNFPLGFLLLQTQGESYVRSLRFVNGSDVCP